MPEQQFLHFAITIGGAAALLLWAVRLVRTGMERAFSHQLRLWLRRSAGNRLLAASSGAGAAMLLQSSTAVALLVANFATAGAMTTGAGLAMLLGADVGSAMVIQFLLQRQAIMIPAWSVWSCSCAPRHPACGRWGASSSASRSCSSRSI